MKGAVIRLQCSVSFQKLHQVSLIWKIKAWIENSAGRRKATSAPAPLAAFGLLSVHSFEARFTLVRIEKRGVLLHFITSQLPLWRVVDALLKAKVSGQTDKQLILTKLFNK